MSILKNFGLSKFDMEEEEQKSFHCSSDLLLHWQCSAASSERGYFPFQNMLMQHQNKTEGEIKEGKFGPK